MSTDTSELTTNAHTESFHLAHRCTRTVKLASHRTLLRGHLTDANDESPGGLSPPGAPRTVREPLDSYGSRCSTVAMTELPVSEEGRICTAKPVKPISRPFGLVTQPFELTARPADDIDIDPLQGRTQPRLVELAVVVGPAFWRERPKQKAATWTPSMSS